VKKFVDFWLPWVIFVMLLVGGIFAVMARLKDSQQDCQGAQKRVEDTFKVMDACQKLIGCTITVDDLRKAQEQINQAEACK